MLEKYVVYQVVLMDGIDRITFRNGTENYQWFLVY